MTHTRVHIYIYSKKRNFRSLGLLDLHLMLDVPVHPLNFKTTETWFSIASDNYIDLGNWNNLQVANTIQCLLSKMFKN